MQFTAGDGTLRTRCASSANVDRRFIDTAFVHGMCYIRYPAYGKRLQIYHQKGIVMICECILFRGIHVNETMSVLVWVVFSGLLAVMSVILQTTSLIIPGWLIVETREFSLNMALWYIILCRRVLVSNATNLPPKCEKLAYAKFFSSKPPSSVAYISKYMVQGESVVATWTL